MVKPGSKQAEQNLNCSVREPKFDWTDRKSRQSSDRKSSAKFGSKDLKSGEGEAVWGSIFSSHSHAKLKNSELAILNHFVSQGRLTHSLHPKLVTPRHLSVFFNI